MGDADGLSVFSTENNPKYGNTDLEKIVRIKKTKPGLKHLMKFLVVLTFQKNVSLELWCNNSGPNIVEMEGSIFLNVGFVYTFRVFENVQ